MDGKNSTLKFSLPIEPVAAEGKKQKPSLRLLILASLLGVGGGDIRARIDIKNKNALSADLRYSERLLNSAGLSGILPTDNCEHSFTPPNSPATFVFTGTGAQMSYLNEAIDSLHGVVIDANNNLGLALWYRSQMQCFRDVAVYYLPRLIAARNQYRATISAHLP